MLYLGPSPRNPVPTGSPLVALSSPPNTALPHTKKVPNIGGAWTRFRSVLLSAIHPDAHIATACAESIIVS